MKRNYLELDNLEAYVSSLRLSNYIWHIVVEWEWFAKRTLGCQFVTAADSISANIAEGFGRYNKKDKIRFYRYAQGSLMEIIDWNNKCIQRNLISEMQNDRISNDINFLKPAINRLIKFTNSKLNY